MSTSSFVPKYQKIFDDIKSKIVGGQLRPDDKLPCRDQIVEQYGVTRATVNHAMGDLLREGLIVTVQRSGTYVAPQAVPTLRRAAFVVHNELLMAHLLDWSSAKKYYAMFGSLFQLVPEDQRQIINLADAQKTPELLKPFGRILWNNLSREDFEHAVEVVGDRSNFLLLNRYYPDCNYVSSNHRKAAFDLAETFLPYLPADTPVALLDIPFGENLSSRFVWLERRNGFIDACEKHHFFYRILEMKQNSYAFNQEQFAEFDKRRAKNRPALLLSPSKELVGTMLGFLRENDYRLGNEYFYGDFNNDNSLQEFGITIPTVSEDFLRIGELAAENLWCRNCRIFVEHTILHPVKF